MSRETSTRAFAPFEWMVALRYLRARRKEGFISVIAGFSFIGITLGVATLIIVMAVMNGFRQELFTKMLGLNGHVVVHSLTNFNDYDDVAGRIRAGTVWINTYRRVFPGAPFGGYRGSGIGRERGLEGLREYTQTKNIMIDVGE